MRFIRDIIAEKSQSAGQVDAAALRYPLRLREQDRADDPAGETPAVHIEADPTAPVPNVTQSDTPQAPNPEAASVDLAAITAALTPMQAAEEPAQWDAPQADPFEGMFEQEEPLSTPLDETTEEPQAYEPDEPHPPRASTAQVAESVGPAQPAPAHLIPEPAEPEVDLAALRANMAAAKPATGRSSKGRVKTRLLGFSAPASQAHDPMVQTREAPVSAQAQFPVGWLVVVDGPGRGASFSLHDGLTQIGRGEGQTVRLDFGDTTISRENHAAIAFDGEQRRFFFGHGGKANLVRLNGRPVLSTEDLGSNSLIRIGETTLRFVALCGEDFVWGGEVAGHDDLV